MVLEKKMSFAKFFVLLVIGAIILGLIILKIYNPKFTTTSFVIFLILFVIVAIVIFFGSKTFSLFGSKGEKKSSQPEPKSMFEMRMMASEAIKHPFFYDTIGKVHSEGSEMVGEAGAKSAIYVIDFDGKKRNPPNRYVIMINQHFPEQKRKILTNPSNADIAKAKNALATSPEEAPNTRTIERENPILGTKETIKEVNHPKKEEIKPVEELK